MNFASSAIFIAVGLISWAATLSTCLLISQKTNLKKPHKIVLFCSLTLVAMVLGPFVFTHIFKPLAAQVVISTFVISHCIILIVVASILIYQEVRSFISNLIALIAICKVVQKLI